MSRREHPTKLPAAVLGLSASVERSLNELNSQAREAQLPLVSVEGDPVWILTRWAERLDRVLGSRERHERGGCCAEWPICPACPGRALVASGGVAWCKRCGQQWPVDRVEPCQWPATVTLRDQSGARRFCASHAAGGLRQISDSSLRVMEGRPGGIDRDVWEPWLLRGGR